MILSQNLAVHANHLFVMISTADENHFFVLPLSISADSFFRSLHVVSAPPDQQVDRTIPHYRCEKSPQPADINRLFVSMRQIFLRREQILPSLLV
jgi:hypothetical protein